MDQSPSELLKTILITAEKHPNTKVYKLIKCFEVERTSQNLALLLMELAEHTEFSADVSISLKYYLDCFEKLAQESSFAETGIVLHNSSKIYAKRVDQIHHEVEMRILSLNNVEKSDENDSSANANSTLNATKEKRGKKRHLEHVNEPYEADMNVKRLKKISDSKRFEDVSLKTKIEMENSVNQMKNYIHPSTWQHSIIEDFDYEDERDSKKNYKLFTYHLEHRYNTLIPDINFKMYFKMKDYIDSECNDSALPESWPPMSDAYIERYLNLEDGILIKEGHYESNQNLIRKITEASEINVQSVSSFDKSNAENDENTNIDSLNISSKTNTTAEQSIEIDVSSDLHISETQTTANLSENESTQLAESQISLSESNPLILNSSNISESGIGLEVTADSQSMYEQTTNESNIETNNEAGNVNEIEKDPTLLDPSSFEEDLSTLKIILPHLTDEGVYFSELDEKDLQMLSPAVVAQDVFRGVKDKSNICIEVDEAIKELFQIKEPSDEIFSLPFHAREDFFLPLNILKIPLKYFKKRSRFKLGPDFNQPKKERLKKYVRRSTLSVHSVPRGWVRLSEDVTGVHVSPPATPSYEPEWLGFPEEPSFDKNRTMSRDSGISLQQTDKEEFAESTGALQSTLNEKANNSSVEDPTEDENNTSEQLNELNEETRVRTKVQEWHSHLQPILARSRERHHFDVFAIGTEIMSKFKENSSSNNRVSFKDVMEEKDESLISRYFLSMLLLANQGNIIIDVENKRSSEPSEMNDIRLKLLSRKRNVVSLEDNIGLKAPQAATIQMTENPTETIVRTLKNFPETPKMDDRDSGIFMSEGSVS